MRLIYTILMATALMIPAAAIAQTSATQQDSGAQQRNGQQGQYRNAMQKHMQRRLAMLTKALDLTTDQQGRLKQIILSEMKQIRDLHQDQSLSQQDQQARLKEIKKQTASQLKALLTPEQQQKLKALRERQREQSQNAKDNDDNWPGPPDKSEDSPNL